MVSRWSKRTLIAALATGWACGSVSSPSRALTGAWGGDHVSMTVADSTHLEFDCAHGDIPASVVLDGAYEFRANGTFVREHGGPIQLGVPPDSHPAVYFGSVAGDTMTLGVRLTDTNETIGTFTLTRGVAGRVVKCV